MRAQFDRFLPGPLLPSISARSLSEHPSLKYPHPCIADTTLLCYRSTQVQGRVEYGIYTCIYSSIYTYSIYNITCTCRPVSLQPIGTMHTYIVPIKQSRYLACGTYLCRVEYRRLYSYNYYYVGIAHLYYHSSGNQKFISLSEARKCPWYI